MIEMLNNLIDNVRQFGIERVFKRYYSVYRAQVISNKDIKKRGRVTVKVPALFGDKPLPAMADARDFRDVAKGKGEFYPPDNGDWVYVEFENGDPRFPVYSGGWYGNGDLDPIFTHTDGVPNVRGYKDKFGNYIIFDQTAGKEMIKIINPNGQKIEMATDGHIFIESDLSGSVQKIQMDAKAKTTTIASVQGGAGTVVFLDSNPGAEKFSATTKAGHQITMDDTAGAELITINHKAGSGISIDKDGSIALAGKDSGLMFFNAKEKEISIISQDGSVVRVADEISLVGKNGSDIIKIDGAGKVAITSATEMSISTNNLSLGSGFTAIGQLAVFSAVLGEQLSAYLSTHIHITPSIGPPVLIPATPMPSLPPTIPPAAFTGTPLDIMALFIKMKGNV